jgi:transcriptional regulator of arginine metabolism
MPTRTKSATHSKEERRQAIVDLVRTQPVRSQAELADLLAARGFDANQATLSRDLRDLGLRKGPDGYELPTELSQQDADRAVGLAHAVREWLTSVAAAQNQLVLRTPPSGAQPLALALDRAPPAGVLGTIAGDDTILVICADLRSARRTARELQRLKERRT